MKYFVFLLFGCFAAVHNTDANEEVVLSEILDWNGVEKLYSECAVNHTKFTDEEFKEYKTNRVIPSSRDGKCMIYCLTRKGKLLGRDGTFTKEQGDKRAKAIFGSDKKLFKIVKTIVEKCAEEAKNFKSIKKCQYAYRLATCADKEAKQLKVRVW